MRHSRKQETEAGEAKGRENEEDGRALGCHRLPSSGLSAHAFLGGGYWRKERFWSSRTIMAQPS